MSSHGRRWAPTLWAPILSALSGVAACEAFVGEYQPDLEIVSSRVDHAALCSLESEFTFEIALDSDEQEEDLTAYYERANPTLVDHLNGVATALHSGESAARATYLWGAAGIGKSFVTRNAFDAFEESEKCTLELADLLTDPPDDFVLETTLVPDLATLDGSLVFNELPGLTAPNTFEITSLFEAGGCLDGDNLRPLIIIDGIDELDDDSSRLILRKVDEFLLEDARARGEFTHVIVAGRPGGFASWLTDPRRDEENNAILDIFRLAAPTYSSAGDLEFRLRGYLDFANLLDGLDDDQFEAYLQSFTSAVIAHPFLTYSIGNLSVGNVVIQHTAPDLDESETELKAGLFDDIIYRNAQSHGRPGDGTEHESAYHRILEEIAAHYVDVNSAGDFVVRSEDSVDVTDDAGGSLGRVRVRNVLNRGGVAVLTSASSTTTRYRFDPFWLHAHLIERRNQRIDPKYDYRGCP